VESRPKNKKGKRMTRVFGVGNQPVRGGRLKEVKGAEYASMKTE
jgi:hypothetical protein